MVTDIHECDGCGEQQIGYTKTQLLARGWRWHDGKKGRWIIVCPACRRRQREKTVRKSAV